MPTSAVVRIKGLNDLDSDDLLFDSDSYRLVPYWDGRRKPSELLVVSELPCFQHHSKECIPHICV